MNDNKEVKNVRLWIARAEAYSLSIIDCDDTGRSSSSNSTTSINKSKKSKSKEIKINDLPLGPLKNIEFEINKELHLFLNNKVFIGLISSSLLSVSWLVLLSLYNDHCNYHLS